MNNCQRLLDTNEILEALVKQTDLCYNLIKKGMPKGKQKRMKAKRGLFMTNQKKNTIITRA